MKGKLRRVLSLVCAVALLAACCISAFGTPASAVDTSNAKDTKWVYDFKSGTGTGDEKPSFLANNESWFYNSTTGKSSVNADGLYVGVDWNNSGEPLTQTYDAVWLKKVWLWDADYDDTFTYSDAQPNKAISWSKNPKDQGFQAVSKGVYGVTVKYKVTEMDKNSSAVYLGVAVCDSQTGANSPDFQRAVRVQSVAKETAVSGEWRYLTAIFDGNDAKMLGGARGNYINLVFSCDKSAESVNNKVLIESVTVENYYDKTNGEYAVRFRDPATGADAAVPGYAIASIGNSIKMPEPSVSRDAEDFKMWQLCDEWQKPYYNYYGGYPGESFNMPTGESKVTYSMNAVFLKEEPSDQKTVYELDVKGLAENKRGLSGAMLSGTTSDANTIAGSLTYKDGEGMSFRSNAGGGAFVDQTGYDRIDSQRIGFYTGKGADAGKWDGNLVQVKYGYTYKFSMTYKVENPDKYGTYIGLATQVNGAYNVWSSMRVIKSWKSTASTGGYVTVTGFFKGDIYHAGNYIGLSIFTNAGVITISKATIEESFGDVNGDVVNIYFNDNTGKPHNPFTGFVGDAIGTLPTPSLSGYEFVGWYTDKTLSTEFTLDKFPETDTNLYAKWKVTPIICDFSSFKTDEWGKINSSRYALTEENGNIFYRYDFANNTSTISANTAGRFAVNDGNRHFSLIEGVKYTVNFKYRIKEIRNQSGGDILIFSSSNYAIWERYNQQDCKVHYASTTDGWVEGEMSFIASFDPETKDNNNYFTMGISGDAVIDIDDITLLSGEARANVYGNLIRFNTNGGKEIDSISGDPGESFTLPTPERAGYKFLGWYTDPACTKLFTDTVFGDTDITLYALWTLGKITEGFENYPDSAKMLNFASGWSLYDRNTEGYSRENVRSGAASAFRNSTVSGSKAFSLMRSDNTPITVGNLYHLTFYVKPVTVTDTNALISLISMSNSAGVMLPGDTETICNFADLKVGEWNKVTFSFTAKDKFVGISATGGNDFYVDDVELVLDGYSGTATGDNSPSVAAIILLMAVCAAFVTTVTLKRYAHK